FASSLSVSLSLTLPPPSISTLFPYTTLFRSILLLQGGAVERNQYPFQSFPRLVLIYFCVEMGVFFCGKDIVGLKKGNYIGKQPQDRKSTRLNSSHVKISYAVFCLKKKTRKHI